MKTLAALFLLVVANVPAMAQRTLHWRAVSVDATLAGDGSLQVRETQAIVFTGDWNGGERRFEVRPRQRFQLLGMQRLDSAGVTHAMTEGDLSVVDGYDVVDRTTLRWRSRLPSDPPFRETAITYVIEYSYENALVPDGDGWILDHDFGFSDRSGVIEDFSVTLQLDDDWQATAPFTGTWSGTNLSPGQGFVVRVPLRYTGPGDGPDVNVGAGPVERGLLAVITLVLLGSFGRRLRDAERHNGRFEPLGSPELVDDRWLEEHLFSHLPEVVGAAWDNTTGASEVAATLARLVGEQKLRSEVTPGGLFKGPVLHLEMLVDRSRFHGHERKLIDALFAAGDTTTSTESIRERYKQTGFNPAEKIQKQLRAIVANMVPDEGVTKPPATPTILAFIGAMALIGIGIGIEPADTPVAMAIGSMVMVLSLVAIGGAVAWRSRVHDVAGWSALFLVPLGIAVGALMVVLATGAGMTGVTVLAGLCLLVVAFGNSIFNQARSREALDRIALRRRFATARAFFVQELKRDSPRLKDEWFPWLIAFGLGKDMDRWFRAFGAESAGHLATVGHSSGGGGYSGSGQQGGGWTGFGGGGGFSGGGASASWAAAAGSLAAGVSSPGSSSSGGGGGGGGGGGSSGGGGGGGW